MVNRRQFIKTGLGYSILPVVAGKAGSILPTRQSPGTAVAGDPLARISRRGRIVMEGPPPGSPNAGIKLPFSTVLQGDAFPQLAHTVLPNKHQFLGPGGKPPKPEEFVDVVIVGGGLAGLTAAYALRHRRPVLLEYADRFGGNSRGETWRDTAFSMGGAYLIDPDPGPMRDTLVELGLDNESVLRTFSGDDAVEVGGLRLPKFWEGEGSRPEEAIKFQQFRERLQFYAFKDYPEMPTGDGSLSATVARLDSRSLKDEISSWIDGDVPKLLAAAIQLYCYSSFNAGWEEVSAASGLNFLAAEEFDLWVYPGGLGQVSRRLWRKTRIATGPDNMRPGMLVFDVRTHKSGVQVTYIDAQQRVRSLVAKAAVIASPKKVYQWMDNSIFETERYNTIRDLAYRSYCVANVLINQPMPDDFYDLFLIQNGVPTSALEATDGHRITDVLSARWASMSGGKESVLTCYWPLPFDPAALHFTFGQWNGEAETNFRQQAAASIVRFLGILDIPAAAVNQVRLTRWGHAMPVSPVGFYNAGKHNILREPIDDRIFFANQDNWALPAIETAMMEAFHFVPAVEAVVCK